MALLRSLALLLGYLWTSSVAAQTSANTSDIAENARASIVKIVVEGTDTAGNQAQPSVGSGFVVASGPTWAKTYIATAAHVLRGPGQYTDDFDSQIGWKRDPNDAPERKIWVEFFDLQSGLHRYTQPATVVDENPKNDSALLVVDGGQYPSLILGDAAVDLPVGANSIAVGYEKAESRASYNGGTRDETDVGTFGLRLKLRFIVVSGQSGGPVFAPDGKVVGIASYNYPKFGAKYHFASLISETVDALTAEGVDPRRAQEIPYRNGTYRGTWADGSPSGTGVFTFEPGHDRIDQTAKAWTLSANFARGDASGNALLRGPLGDDKLPQHCELTLFNSRVENGSCSIYFNNFSSTTGIDPSVRLLIQQGRDTSDSESHPGSATFTGRYEGAIVGGSKSFFESSDYSLAQRMSEEFLQPQGEGVFYVAGGSATISTVNWSLDLGAGAMILSGHWVLGSFTGKGSIRYPNGSSIEGTFDADYIADGTATNATGHLFGTAGFDSDVYTGHMRGGLKAGSGELNNELKHYSMKGEFRNDFLWNGTMIYQEDGKQYCSFWTENTQVSRHEMRGAANHCP